MQRTCLAGSSDSQLAFWLMIVSTATVVLPVCRSPLMSSRWPRPMGIIESMALMPVCSGSSTDLRSITPGACSSRARRPSATISPRPSIGWPSGLTTLPRKWSPTGTERTSAVRLTSWPSSTRIASSAISVSLLVCGPNSVRTEALCLVSAWIQFPAMVSWQASCALRSATGLHPHRAFGFLEPAQNRAVDNLVADLNPDAADNRGVEHDGDLDRPVVDPGQSLGKSLSLNVVQADRCGDRCGQLGRRSGSATY